MKLFYKKKAGACSLATYIVLHETGLPHTSVAVDLKTKRTAEGDDFLAINSKGYVPALQLDNGPVLTESAVIAQNLADLKPESNLLAASGEARYAGWSG
ncbi:glutathione S-transferase N-terminal domain-containing protein [Candidatus Pantoea persica]|uniref:glutathione S-transferase N-terminal domain-containing protein n=1 Tax=Candidatus Pantoea persica TaxID=2518128 RepID=UPI00215D9770|nr:glutathione S-transferase N-terminal domain-containing protein [Candidatus Pantoea persica]MBA2813961.1 glutathione S-transferase [Candidatus Pantoea persica]